MKIVDHIGIFENGVPLELCEALIQSFNMWEQNREFIDSAFIDGENLLKGGILSRSDVQMYLEAVELDLAKKVGGVIRTAFEEYATVYKGIIQGTDPVSSWTTKVQRTKPGGGYHQWHCENGVFVYRDRVLSWMVYLNTIPIENGGGTDFLYQKLSLQPKVGTLVLWPAAYTHMHRGAFLTGDIDKYIATGWFVREAGQTVRDSI